MFSRCCKRNENITFHNGFPAGELHQKTCYHAECFPLFSGAFQQGIFQVFLGLGKSSENAMFNVHFPTGVFHRQTCCFPECFPRFSVAFKHGILQVFLEFKLKKRRQNVNFPMNGRHG